MLKRSHIIVGTTLACGEDGIIYSFFQIISLRAFLFEENETGTRSAKGLVSVEHQSTSVNQTFHSSD